MRYTFAADAVKHYSAAVAREVIITSAPRRVLERPGVLMWKAPSEQAASEHAKRPQGRTGPIEVVVLARELDANHRRVFHCFRPRGRDVAAWETSTPVS